MKVVLDTNVIVSGLLSPYSAPGEIVRMVASGTLELAYDARILLEYTEVLLRPKFSFHKQHVDDFLTQIKHGGHAIAANPLSIRLMDLDDEAFLEVALTGKVLCLITGNKKHYPQKARQGMIVVSPREFLDLLVKRY